MENKMRSVNYLGNCTNIFDEDGDCIVSCFRDTSDFACVEEDATTISEEEFLQYLSHESEFIMLPSGNYTFMKYNEDNRFILMAYNSDEDIHYFYN